MRISLVPALALACAAFAQTPAFEVASVKRSEPITPAMVQSGRLHMGVSIDAMNVRISQYSLYEMTCLAYQVKGHQISGPSWMVTERYDVQAKLPEGARRGQVPAMLQTLLAERFSMRVHKENRQLSVYALVVDKNGPRLKPSEAPDAPPASSNTPLRGGMNVGAGGAAISSGPSGDSMITPGQGGNVHVQSKKMTLEAFAGSIGRYTDLPVLDMTGIKGTYEMEYDVSGEEVRNAARAHGVNVATPRTEAAPGESAPEPAGVSLASSLRKLGLKLEPRKAPVEVIVIDSVEKTPTQN